MDWQQEINEISIQKQDLVVDLDDFDIQDIIGVGGYGEVRKSIQKSTGKECAIKKIYAEKLVGSKMRRYFNEINTMSQTDNLFLINFVGFTDKEPYSIITEYMPNMSLNKYVTPHSKDREKYISLEGTQLTKIAIGVAYGMIHLHKLGIIHRDLKAANVLLDNEYLPKICDFGISRFENPEGEMTGKIGTPNYMAPELIESQPYNTKVDVYSFGMMLYEMSEKTKAFKNSSIVEIFNCVINYDLRPKFTYKTPTALQYLIKRCWSRDPNQRPTFEEVFGLFCSGSACFLGTKRSEIIKFIKKIEKDESQRNGVTHSYMMKFAEASQWGSSKSENKKANSSKKKGKKSSKKNLPHKNIYAGILNNTENPKFKSTLMKQAKIVIPSSFNDFFSPLYTHFYYQKECVPIMKAAQLMMERNIQFIQCFDAISFFGMMPMRNKEETDNACECLSYVFTESPCLLTDKYIDIINKLISKRPKKMLILHSFYARSFNLIDDPFLIIDNMMKAKETFMKKEVGYLFISILFFLLKEFPKFAEKRKKEAIDSIVYFLNSDDQASIISAYDALAQYEDVEMINIDTLVKHLNNSKLWNSVISLLMRMKNIPITVPMLNILLLRSHVSPRPWLVLLKIASTLQGANFLLLNTQWSNEVLRHPKQITQLFMVIFDHDEYKEKCIRLGEFPFIANALLDTYDPKFHSCISTIIRRSDNTMDLLMLISNTGILKKYIEVTINAKNMKMYKHSLITFDCLARIGYAQDYLLYVDLLIELASKSETMNAAITVIVQMSYYVPTAFLFKEKGVEKIFKKLSTQENYKKAVETFMENIK